MVTAFNDLTMFQDDDRLGIADSGKTMRDNKYRSAFHEGIHSLFDQVLGTCVNGAGRLVENQDRRVGDVGTCNRKQLPLSL